MLTTTTNNTYLLLFGTARYFPLPHPTSATIEYGGIEDKNSLTRGHGAYRVCEK